MGRFSTSTGTACLTADYTCALFQVYTDDMEIPELPANYVMDEFMKAKEQAAMPKKGTVKNKADSWLEQHHD